MRIGFAYLSVVLLWATTPLAIKWSITDIGFLFEKLLNGLDDIGLTLQHVDKIDGYEVKHEQNYPWLWA